MLPSLYLRLTSISIPGADLFELACRRALLSVFGPLVVFFPVFQRCDISSVILHVTFMKRDLLCWVLSGHESDKYLCSRYLRLRNPRPKTPSPCPFSECQPRSPCSSLSTA